MNALPISELSRLECASEKKAIDPEGNQVSFIYAYRSNLFSLTGVIVKLSLLMLMTPDPILGWT